MPKKINEILPGLLKSLVIPNDETFESIDELARTDSLETFRQQLFNCRSLLGLPDDSEEYQFNDSDDSWFDHKDYDFNLGLIRQKAALYCAMRHLEHIHNDQTALKKMTQVAKYDDLPLEITKPIKAYGLPKKVQEEILKEIKAQAQKYQQFHTTIEDCVTKGDEKLNKIIPKCTKKSTTHLLSVKKTLPASEKEIANNITKLEKDYITRLLKQMKATNQILSELPTQNKSLAEREKEAQNHLKTISQLEQNIEKSIEKHNQVAKGTFKQAQLLRAEDNDIYKTHIIRQHDTLPAAITALRNELKIKNTPDAKSSVAASSNTYADNEKLAEKEYIAGYLEPGETQVTIRDAKSGSLPAIFTQDHKGGITYEADNDALEELSDIVVHDAFRVAQDLLVSTILRHGKDNLEQVRLTINGSSAKQTQRVHAALLLLIQQGQLKIKPEHILNINKRAQTPQVGTWSLTGLSSTAGNQSRFIQEQLGGTAHRLTTGYSATAKIDEHIKHANILLKEQLQQTTPKSTGDSDKQNISEGTRLKPGQ